MADPTESCHGAADQSAGPGDVRLRALQNKESPPSLVFIFLDLWAQLFFGQLLRAVLVRAFLLKFSRELLTSVLGT